MSVHRWRFDTLSSSSKLVLKLPFVQIDSCVVGVPARTEESFLWLTTFTKKLGFMSIKLLLLIEDQLKNYEEVARHWKSKSHRAPKTHIVFEEILL